MAMLLLNFSQFLPLVSMNHLLFSLPKLLHCRSASSLIMMLLTLIGTQINQLPIASATTFEIAQSPSSPINAPQADLITKQLLGQWQTKDPTSNTQFTFIFAPENKLFVVLPASDGSLIALKVAYQINPTVQPMQLDIQLSPEQKALTIFEFTTEGQLRLALDGLTPGLPRPNQFKGKEVLFAKTSATTTLPENIQVIEPEIAQKKTPQDEVKTYMSALVQVQQAHYREQGKFAATIEEVSVGLKTETDYYSYKIVPQDNDTKSVMITAQAKTEKIPSYTGAVFTTQIDGKTTTVAQICETEKPSTTPPIMPNAPTIGSVEIKCPAGSRSLISK